jgi:hypothetical protein
MGKNGMLGGLILSLEYLFTEKLFGVRASEVLPLERLASSIV